MKSKFPCLANLWNPQLGEWKLSNANMNWSWSGEAVQQALSTDPECCMMMRSRWCQWQGSWVSGVEGGLKSSFTFCMGSRVNSRKCVYPLYLSKILECTCDTASTYNQAGAVCLWRHWQLGVKECHGTGWCWYVLARTSVAGRVTTTSARLWDNLLHSFTQLWHKKDGRDIPVGIPDTQLD